MSPLRMRMPRSNLRLTSWMSRRTAHHLVTFTFRAAGRCNSCSASTRRTENQLMSHRQFPRQSLRTAPAGTPASMRCAVRRHAARHPTATQGKEGRRRETVPLMNESLTLPAGQTATVASAIQTALRGAARSRNRRIELGSMLPNQFWDITLPVEPTPMAARDWISKALAAGGVKMSWLLLYDPTFDYYAFTLYPI